MQGRIRKYRIKFTPSGYYLCRVLKISDDNLFQVVGLGLLDLRAPVQLV